MNSSNIGIMKSDVLKAVEILKKGGVVIFPTDTAFGIGCRIDDEKAVARLFKLRRRAETKAVPVLVSSAEMAKKYWKLVPDVVVKELVNKYWPGALTIILHCNTVKVPDLVRGGRDTLGLRMPDNEALLEIIQEVGVPVIGTSANFAGEATPYKFEDLDPELVKLVDYVLPGSFVDTQDDSMGRASTVIDCTVAPWRVLRQGAVEVRDER